MTTIRGDEIAGWLAGLAMKPQSRRTNGARVRSFFRWLVLTRQITQSPCDGLRLERIVAEDVNILTVEQGAQLFARNVEHRELCGRLALEAFCGLRFSSAGQVAAADIDFAARGIVLPAAKIKTRRRQYIDGLPDNLWAWLEWSQPKTWSMTPRAYLQAKSLAFVRANIPHPHNCLRHSFASYFLSMTKDASRTSVILCHASPKMLWAHYRGRATEADGKTWFGILPPP